MATRVERTCPQERWKPAQHPCPAISTFRRARECVSIRRRIASIAGQSPGPGALKKSGAGTLTLTGNNSYSGGTDVSAGTLEASTTSVSGNINVSSGARMRFNQTSDSIYSGAI
ncbi:hypothetical protein FMN63_11230, partial [Stappia sp. BW2]